MKRKIKFLNSWENWDKIMRKYFFLKKFKNIINLKINVNGFKRRKVRTIA